MKQYYYKILVECLLSDSVSTLRWGLWSHSTGDITMVCLGRRGFKPWPNPSSDLLSVSLLYSTKHHINNQRKDWNALTAMIMWPEHPGMTNKIRKGCKIKIEIKFSAAALVVCSFSGKIFSPTFASDFIFTVNFFRYMLDTQYYLQLYGGTNCSILTGFCCLLGILSSQFGLIGFENQKRKLLKMT